MRDLREGTAATVQIGQLVGPGGVTDVRSVTLSGTSAYIYKGVAQATGVSTLMTGRNWEHSHMGFYQLEIKPTDSDITGPLHFTLASGHPVTFLGVWETFNVMDADVFDSKYGDSNLKVMTTSGVTMDSGVTLNAGAIITSGVSIKPGIYSGVTLAGVSNVINTDFSSGVSVKAGIYSGVTISGVSNVINPTVASIWANTDRSLTSGVTMDSGVTLNAGVIITSGVSIKPGIYSGVTLAGVSNVINATVDTNAVWTATNRSLTSGVTMDSGVTINAGTYSGVSWAGITNVVNVIGGVTVLEFISGVSIKPGIYSGVTLAGVSNVINATLDITSGVSIKPGIYSGVTLAGVSNVVTMTPTSIWANADRSLTSGVTMDSGVTLNAGVNITSGVSIKSGIYSGVTISGVSNLINPTVASIWANADRSLTSGVTMDSGVTLNAGTYSGVTTGGVLRIEPDQGAVTIGWVMSGATVGSATEHKQLRMALGLAGVSVATEGNGLIDFMHKTSGGRWKIFTTGVSINQMVFYEADNTTVLAVYNLLDSAAAATYQNTYERTRA